MSETKERWIREEWEKRRARRGPIQQPPQSHARLLAAPYTVPSAGNPMGGHHGDGHISADNILAWMGTHNNPVTHGMIPPPGHHPMQHGQVPEATNEMMIGALAAAMLANPTHVNDSPPSDHPAHTLPSIDMSHAMPQIPLQTISVDPSVSGAPSKGRSRKSTQLNKEQPPEKQDANPSISDLAVEHGQSGDKGVKAVDVIMAMLQYNKDVNGDALSPGSTGVLAEPKSSVKSRKRKELEV